MISILQLPKGRKIVLALVMLPGTLVIGYVKSSKLPFAYVLINLQHLMRTSVALRRWAMANRWLLVL